MTQGYEMVVGLEVHAQRGHRAERLFAVDEAVDPLEQSGQGGSTLGATG